MISANHLLAGEQDTGEQDDPNTGPNTSSDYSSTPTNPDSADTQTAGSKEAQRT